MEKINNPYVKEIQEVAKMEGISSHEKDSRIEKLQELSREWLLQQQGLKTDVKENKDDSMKLFYKKTSIVEDEKDKILTCSFEGVGGNDFLVKLSVKGVEKDISNFLEKLKISYYGQEISVKISNPQQTVE